MPYKQRVAGSNPAVPTLKYRPSEHEGLFIFVANHTTSVILGNFSVNLCVIIC
jgi:hypothetical protein